VTVDESAALRVVIADDHAPTRASVRDALERDGRFVVCAESSDASGAISAALAELPDIALLDVRMPGGGIAAVWEIAARLPETSLVMLTVSDQDSDLLGAIRAGADGYLLKDMDADRLPQALWEVKEGAAAIPGTLVARLLAQLRDPTAKRRLLVHHEGPHLTSREWEILELLREGLSTAAIARRLSLTPATVRSHRARLVRKLEAAGDEIDWSHQSHGRRSGKQETAAKRERRTWGLSSFGILNPILSGAAPVKLAVAVAIAPLALLPPLAPRSAAGAPVHRSASAGDAVAPPRAGRAAVAPRASRSLDGQGPGSSTADPRGIDRHRLGRYIRRVRPASVLAFPARDGDAAGSERRDPASADELSPPTAADGSVSAGDPVWIASPEESESSDDHELAGTPTPASRPGHPGPPESDPPANEDAPPTGEEPPAPDGGPPADPDAPPAAVAEQPADPDSQPDAGPLANSGSTPATGPLGNPGPRGAGPPTDPGRPPDAGQLANPGPQESGPPTDAGTPPRTGPPADPESKPPAKGSPATPTPQAESAPPPSDLSGKG
jgi:DNA-binding NarL/FixJ family response regulator